MAKEYNHIRRAINSQAKSFKIYLKDFLLDPVSWQLLNVIATQTHIYIFSGVIRNFLLGEYENRDLDIVVSEMENIRIPKDYLKSIIINKNSFGGFKIKIGQLQVDVWDIKNTWGLQKLNLRKKPYNLINTAFFNFSAIIYDFNKERFIFNEKFESFYFDKSIDIVYKDNPNKALCIINTIYYSQKYYFIIKRDLCKWIVENSNFDYDYNKVQIKHFGKIIYSIDNINHFIELCKIMLKIYNSR